MKALFSTLALIALFGCGGSPSTDGTLGALCRYGNTVARDGNGNPIGKPTLAPCRSGLQCCGIPDTDGYCGESCPAH
jgi:hypothetical protein